MSELPVQCGGMLGSSIVWFKQVAVGSYWTGRHSGQLSLNINVQWSVIDRTQYRTLKTSARTH